MKNPPSASSDTLVGSKANTPTSPIQFQILEITKDQVLLSAGLSAGLKPGQELRVIRSGKQVKEPSTSLVLQLPGEEIGRIQVVSQFGTGGPEEGSICKVLGGWGFTLQDHVELLPAPEMEDDF